MTTIRKSSTSIYYLDKIIYTLILMYALSSSISRGGVNVAVSLVLLMAIIRYIIQPLPINVDKGFLRAVIFFLITMLFSTFFSQNIVESFTALGGIIYRLSIIFIIMAFITKKHQILKILILLCISLLIADFYSFWQAAHGDFRAGAFSSHPSNFGGYLMLIIPLLAVVNWDDKLLPRNVKKLTLFTLIISLPALLVNGTRGAWIAVIITFLVYGIISFKSRPKLVAIMLVLILLIGFIAYMIPQVQERVLTMTDMKFQSNSERLLMWHSAWQMFLDYPITGVGLGNWHDFYFGHYISDEAKERAGHLHAHNNFFTILAETGLIGILGFCYMFAHILLAAYRRYLKNTQNLWNKVTLLLTVSFLSHGMVDYTFGVSVIAIMYWFILGLTYAASNVDEVLLSENKTTKT